MAQVASELEELGAAVDLVLRRRALAAYREAPAARAVPKRWRHREDALRFDDLWWSSGRLRVPSGEGTTGIAHAGSIYLEPAGGRRPDERVTLAPLADIARTDPQRIAGILGRLIAPEADRFAALTTAFANCGVYLEIAAGATIAEPIPIVWTARPGAHAAVFAQTVVRVGAGARATVIERHVGESESFVCATVEAELGRGAALEYVAIQQADEGTRIAVRRVARCAEGAAIGWHLASLGGALARDAIEVPLAQPDTAGAVNALFFVSGFANADLAVNVAHLAPHTHGETIVRGVARDRGIGRFTGNVRIGPGGAGARAGMRADALVLSRDAYIEATPALEIENDDVAASHAATVGSLDEDQLFYAQSRGIDRASAERMVALAFFEPALAGFPSETLRDEIRSALDRRLDEVGETFAS